MVSPCSVFIVVILTYDLSTIDITLDRIGLYTFAQVHTNSFLLEEIDLLTYLLRPIVEDGN